jgi:branched-chain amino acid transport system permease protein
MTAITGLFGRGSRNNAVVVDYRQDLRLFPSALAKAAVLTLVVLWLFTPQQLTDYPLNVLNYAGVTAIGAIGLNLLIGYTGQVSLGHAFFIGVGAYTAAYLGADQGWPLVVWLPAAAVIGGLIGAAIGPFALRLRGNYLVIVTLGLVFVGEYIFDNWDSVTGGGNGTSVAGAIPRLDTATFELFGQTYSRDQGFFWLIWALVAVVALLAKNIIRSRPGRAMQAVRDRDLAAEIVGVSLARYKVSAFAVSSAIAALAGGLYGALQAYVQPTDFDLVLSIQYIAIIIIGGVGTIFGSVLGALVLGSLPRIIERVTTDTDLPLVSGDAGGTDGFIAVASLNVMLYGLLIVLFLVFEPHGLAGLWFRVKSWFKSWPFSY